MIRRSVRLSHTVLKFPLRPHPPSSRRTPAPDSAPASQGCTLPIELWFFDVEMPDGEMRAVLEAMGVTVRNVDEITPGASTEIFKNGLDGFGYVMKVSAQRILSRPGARATAPALSFSRSAWAGR